MKKLRILLVTFFLLCGLGAMAACSLSALETPENVKVNYENAILTWDEVKGADGYRIDIDGRTSADVEAPPYSLAGVKIFDPGVEYKLRVRALGDKKDFSNSAWSEPAYYTPEEDVGLRYTLSEDKRSYLVSGINSIVDTIHTEAPYDTHLGKPVSGIADSAFAQNTRIVNVKLGKNIKTIGTRAFYGCLALTNVDFSECNALETIGEYAFQSCRSLESVVLPDSLKTIGPFTFNYCRALGSVTIGKGITEIGESAFADCSALTSLTIPDNVETIGQQAFSACSGISSLKLGGGLKTIGTGAFYNCTGLETLTLEDGITTISDGMFIGCSSLTAVTIPDTVESVGQQAFYGCTALRDVTVGTGVTTIGPNAFDLTGLWIDANEDWEDGDGDGLVYAGDWLVANIDLVYGSTGEGGELRIKAGTVGIASAVFMESSYTWTSLPDTIRYLNDYAFCNCANLTSLIMSGAALETIGDYAFYGCTSLTNVAMGKGVKSIGSYAFYGCTRLRENVDLPDTLEKIGTYAFYNSGYWQASAGLVYVDDWVVGNKNSYLPIVTINDGIRGISDYAFYLRDGSMLMQITIPETVQFIGVGAFYGCAYMQTPALHEGLKVIENYAFYGCSAISSIVIPESVTSIGRSAFYQCSSLEGIKIPSAVTYIGDYAFFQCTGLRSVTFGEDSALKTIASRAFYGCAALGNVDLPKGLETIGQQAFRGCAAMTSVSIPDSVTSVDIRAFQGCSSVTEISIGKGITEISDYMFADCALLTAAVIPDTIVRVGDYAFYKCVALGKIELGARVESVGAHAFQGAAEVQHLLLPASVTAIGDQAFRGCNGLTSIVLRASVESVGRAAFYGCNYMTVYCEAAERPDGWHEQWNITYRPTVWGCVLGGDGTYVESFKMGEYIDYYNARNGISAPERAGYRFDHWQSGKDSFTAQDVWDAPEGITLTAVWSEE